MALTLKADEAKALTAEAEPNESVGNPSDLGPPDEPSNGPQYPTPDWWNGSAGSAALPNIS